MFLAIKCVIVVATCAIGAGMVYCGLTGKSIDIDVTIR